MSKPLTKTQIKKLMTEFDINGDLSGKGEAWEVELPDEKTMRKFVKKIAQAGGYQTGYGGWVLRPGYVGRGDFMNPGSDWHYY